MGRIRRLLPVIARPSGTVATPAYLAGDIDPGDVAAAYIPKGKASLALSYVNQADPGTHDAAPGTAPALVAGGWSFTAASTQFLITDLVPVSGWSMLVQFSDVTGTGFLCGSYSGTNTRFFIQPASGGSGVVYGMGDARSATPSKTSGNLGTAGQQGYREGVADQPPASAWSGTPSRAFYIGAINNEGSAFGHITAVVSALFVYTTVLTADQMLAVRDAMTAL